MNLVLFLHVFGQLLLFVIPAPFLSNLDHFALFFLRIFSSPLLQVSNMKKLDIVASFVNFYLTFNFQCWFGCQMGSGVEKYIFLDILGEWAVVPGCGNHLPKFDVFFFAKVSPFFLSISPVDIECAGTENSKPPW